MVDFLSRRFFAPLSTVFPSSHKSKWTRHARRSTVRLRLESLEDRLAPATLSDGGTAALSIAIGANENLAIVSNGSSYTFTSNQAFTSTSAADPANQAAAFAGFGGQSLTLTSTGLAQYATGINIVDTGANATVTFNDSGANGFGNNFNVSLSNAGAGTIGFHGKSSFSTFNLRATTTRNIMLNPSADVSSTTGNITLRANQQVSPTSGDFIGVSIQSAILECTGTGQITVEGRGGDTREGQVGVLVTDGNITAETGSLIVTGTGGTAAGGSNYGVWVYFHAAILSQGGDVTVTGTGGAGSGSFNDGVYVLQGSKVAASGQGNVTVIGTGGVTTGTNDEGVRVAGIPDLGATIEAEGGAITIVGNGGVGPEAPGVILTGAQVIDSGSGNVTVQGFGGSVGPDNTGFFMDSGASITTGGDIAITGKENDTFDRGIDLDGTVSTTKAGARITLTADAVILEANAQVNGSNGSVTVRR